MIGLFNSVLINRYCLKQVFLNSNNTVTFNMSIFYIRSPAHATIDLDIYFKYL